MKGLIALDIDGTVTNSHRSIPKEIVAKLEGLAADGWQIVFITGRPFFHCVQLCRVFTFNYYIAPQNGAAVVSMPERQVVKKRYLNRSIIKVMDEICAAEGTDYVIYSGLENHDCVFFRPTGFSDETRDYLSRRTREFCEDWHSLGSFDLVDQPEFASVKCFAKAESAARLASEMERRLDLHAPIIRDPFDEAYCVIQGSHPEVSKGQAVRDIQEMLGLETRPVIAAGDDCNDLPLLKAATTAIAIETAPKELLALADIISKPPDQLGLVDALEEAVARIS